MPQLAMLLVIAAGLLAAQASPQTSPQTAQGPVSFDRLIGAAKEPHNWLTYSGDMNSQRHSALTQITPDNVKNLELQWVFQAKSLERYESTPLVVDGVMYTIQNPDDVVAL